MGARILSKNWKIAFLCCAFAAIWAGTIPIFLRLQDARETAVHPVIGPTDAHAPAQGGTVQPAR